MKVISKRTLFDYISVILGSGIARVFAFFSTVIIARLIGPGDYGQFNIFYTIYMFVRMPAQAFDTTYVRYAKTAASEQEKNSFLKTAIFLKLLYGLSLILLCYPLGYLLAVYVFQKQETTEILMWSLISGVFISFLATLASVFQEKEKFFSFSLLNLIHNLVIFLAQVFFIIFGIKHNLGLAVWLFILSSILTGSISLVFLLKKTGWLLPINLKQFNKSFALAKWIFITSCLTYAFHRLGTVFASRYSSFTDVGIFSAAFQLVFMVSFMIGSLSSVFLPKASKALDSKAALKHYIRESLVACFGINFFILLMMIFSPLVVTIIYGKDYLPAIPILRILLAGWFVYIFYLPFSYLFYTLDDSRTLFYIECFKIILAIGLMLFLVPRFNIIGAAIGQSVVFILTCFLGLGILRFKIAKKKLKAGYNSDGTIQQV